ncbi:MAG: Formamidopyrimidine-DNA glycosylase [SAR92 bacterium MED-G29]|nr:MAG: Formamidopyrimidine-DNA glycosylase [SAR92 bacterium MED-G29]
MPELPEVETTLRGIEPAIALQVISGITVRQGSLRWPVTEGLAQIVEGQRVTQVRRRAKYLIINLEHGSMLIHLGMSGSLRLVQPDAELRKHDHIEMRMGNGAILRYHDPRRFGCWLWSESDHHQLSRLGPEPLSDDFGIKRLYELSRKRKIAVKPFIMDNNTVVGVGNIYASEALFRSGIRPDRAAGDVSLKRYTVLTGHIKEVLAAAIVQGGTTLRDFVNGNGEPGYFQQTLAVYGRGGELCTGCEGVLKEIKLGQRSSVFCPRCQR